MVAFIVGVSTIFLRQFLIEKGALVEFSDRMSNVSLMAPATAFKHWEQFLSWDCDLHSMTLLAEHPILHEYWWLPQMGGDPNVVPRQVPELSWLTVGCCVLIDGDLVFWDLSDQTLLLQVQNLLKGSLLVSFFKSGSGFVYSSLKYGET